MKEKKDITMTDVEKENREKNACEQEQNRPGSTAEQIIYTFLLSLLLYSTFVSGLKTHLSHLSLEI